jgi:hypothetical protein
MKFARRASSTRRWVRRIRPWAFACAIAFVVVGCPPPPVTYHQNALRTGWDELEITLNPSNVSPSTFGLVGSTVLDDQVDTQPLVVASQTIAGLGSHTVAYVATEGNTVYAIDGISGAILKSTNLGAPVQMPLGCGNNGPNVGIDGTPALDVKNQILYVIAYVQGAGGPQYQLHALDPATLGDKPGSPVTVAVTHQLTNSSTPFAFNASVQRQRSALLLANGNVYAAFGSFCDFSGDISRGWVLGWNATTLAPLAANELTDTLATAPGNFFLASVWMSGYGLAADASGYLYFVTGNGNEATVASPNSIQESVVKLSPDLSTVVDLFTPSNAAGLDHGDVDYGSGGVLLLPDQPGPLPHLAVAAGKDGRMFIMNRDHLGGFHNPDVPPNVSVGACWCGPSYFKGSDGVGRVVSSGGTQVQLWKVNQGSPPSLTLEGTSAAVEDGITQDTGFFTTVSSALTAAGTGVIWAVGRPPASSLPTPNNMITLYAFDATPVGGTLPPLWSGIAGTWPNRGGNANLVPTVSGGRVYVASYKRLAIFGLVSGFVNECGGSRPLAQTPGTSCEDIPTRKCGLWKCLGPRANSVTCDTTADGTDDCGGCGLLALPETVRRRKGDHCFCSDPGLTSGTLVCSADKKNLICCPCNSAPGCGPGSPPFHHGTP